MGRNFDAPMGETEITRDSGRAKGGNRLTALTFAVAASAAVAAIPSEARAQTGPSIEFEELDVTLKGTVLNGILIVSGETGGWFSSTKGTLRIPLKGVVADDQLRELEGHEVEVEIEGKKEDGVFRGEIRTKSGFRLPMPLSFGDLGTLGLNRTSGSCTQPDCAPRPRSCNRPADCGRPARRVSPPLAPEPADEAESGLVRLKKPFDPGTFYVDRPEAGKSMGEGHPRGFDVEKDGSITFFVTGDKSGKTSISIELYPWVPAENVTAKVTIDGEEYEMVPQPLPKGKILPSSKTGGEALLDTPVRLAAIPIPPGTHEITMSSANSRFRAVLRGAKETAKPDVDAAIERPFEENPDFPPEFYMNARVVTAAEQPSGYRLEPITKSPVRLEEVRIERIQNSTLVRVRLIIGDIAYVSEKPLMPHMDHRVLFTRVTPPARSTDSEGPDELPLNVKVPKNPQDMYQGKVNDLTCRTFRPANLYCWKVSEDESRVRAFRARLDTRPTSSEEKPRHHILRKY